jgi:hypothetical protein
MDPLDRLQALIRHPDYCRIVNHPSLRRLQQGLDSYLIERLWDKDDNYINAIQGLSLLRVWGIDRTVDPGNKDRLMAEMNGLQSKTNPVFKDDLRARIVDLPSRQTTEGKNRFIAIMVDLKAPTVRLLPIIAAIINRERTKRSIKVGKKVPCELNPRDIWDRMQLPGNNLLRITRELFRVHGNLNYDETEGNKISACYEKVKRAYHRAKSLIEEVGKSRREPLTDEEATIDLGVATSLAGIRLVEFASRLPGADRRLRKGLQAAAKTIKSSASRDSLKRNRLSKNRRNQTRHRKRVNV